MVGLCVITIITDRTRWRCLSLGEAVRSWRAPSSLSDAVLWRALSLSTARWPRDGLDRRAACGRDVSARTYGMLSCSIPCSPGLRRAACHIFSGTPRSVPQCRLSCAGQ